ncbi:MAG TPA: chemotaxis protein CheW [Pyrinomonadaceae bacterium]|nr:chemotaxis protein CheW [Pyrinomonadaceae bacterium]
MTEKTDFADISILPRSLGQTGAEEVRERLELLVARCGERLIAVSASEAENVVAWKRPSPLPNAPLSVLGVVSVRGRVSTVLDPLALLGEGKRRDGEAASFNFIITLRGDEQLALAVERAERIMEVFAEDVQPMSASSGTKVVRGLLQTEGKLVAVLNVQELFRAAMQGTERRRRRN